MRSVGATAVISLTLCLNYSIPLFQQAHLIVLLFTNKKLKMSMKGKMLCVSTYMYSIILLLILRIQCCTREPSIYHTKVNKLSGDDGFAIGIHGSPTKYMPGQLYTLHLMGSRSFERIQHFRRFSITVEATDDPSKVSPQRVGSFQLFPDSLVQFNEECINTLIESNDLPKTEVIFMWAAPPPNSGCVTFRAMILQDPYHWYADEGKLSLSFCEQTEKDMMHDENECCACDEAKYRMVFEGIWSNVTHPKDFPFSLWLTHFSDIIGATHERNFTFWGEGQIASEGFRSLAEWGSVRLMETELRAKSRFLRSIIKAAGLWYPNVNTNASSSFRVDRRHHLLSLASMFGPSPDWVVGVNGLELCLKNCTWIENLILNLYPYDAGTDNGITYMSPNSETDPREPMYRITQTYPEDPRSPFYDPRGPPMQPLARLYLFREKVISRSCDESFLSAQLESTQLHDTAGDDDGEGNEKPECAVTNYTEWSGCSVTCGKGLRMRSRKYRMPEKAAMLGCKRQLISKEMCVADQAECTTQEDNGSDENQLSQTANDNDGICKTSPWSDWSECTPSCGIGFKMRNRYFIEKMGRKKCPHISIVEKEKCMGPPCGSTEKPDPMCPTTEWSDWSPCSSLCGAGTRIRTRLLLVDEDLQRKCQNQIQLAQQSTCEGTEECAIASTDAKAVCMEPVEHGPCHSTFTRWYFEPRKGMCVPFQYGGCRGNRNNFESLAMCQQACGSLLGGNQQDAYPFVNFARKQSPTRASTTSTTTRYAPIDCIVTEWSAWGPCSAPGCGLIGIMEKVRSVKRPPRNGGARCPSKLVRRKKCIAPGCASASITTSHP